jgi:hypothetical protein
MSRATRVRLLDNLRHRDALTLLKGNSARTISGCYVNPNAKCPVCGDAVYFYANEHGSRVFFDDLGPPWPKHPCTDNPREPVTPLGAPTRRTRGMMQELITAANRCGPVQEQDIRPEDPGRMDAPARRLRRKGRP